MSLPDGDRRRAWPVAIEVQRLFAPLVVAPQVTSMSSHNLHAPDQAQRWLRLITETARGLAEIGDKTTRRQSVAPSGVACEPED